MTQIETSARKRRAKENIQTSVLSILAVSGTLAVAMVAPNALQLLKFAKLDRAGKQKVGNAFRRLVQKGYITLEQSDGKKYARLTPAGKLALMSEYEKARTGVRSNRRWDGQWRVVIFDIPEKRRRTRDQLRSLMVRAGFKQLQGSVWVFPYDCEELLTLIKSELKVGKDILYMVVSALEYDQPLRKHFGLRA